jgi:hypothetical protein
VQPLKRILSPTLLVLLLAAVAPAGAAELVPYSEGDFIGVQLRGMRLPDSLRQDLVSGLTNRMLIRMTLATEGRTISQSVVAIGVKYDLWEESFRMTLSVDDRELPAQTFARIEDVLNVLADLPLNAVFRSSDLQAGRAHTLLADVLFDPVDRERMENIRRWVSRNSTIPTSGAPTPTGASSPSAALFNAIFEQYAEGADIASTARDSATSAAFRPEQLKTRPGALQR